MPFSIIISHLLFLSFCILCLFSWFTSSLCWRISFSSVQKSVHGRYILRPSMPENIFIYPYTWLVVWSGIKFWVKNKFPEEYLRRFHCLQFFHCFAFEKSEIFIFLMFCLWTSLIFPLLWKHIVSFLYPSIDGLSIGLFLCKYKHLVGVLFVNTGFSLFRNFLNCILSDFLLFFSCSFFL